MKIKKLVQVITCGTLATVSAMTIAADTSVEALSQRLEMMQKEMNELKRQLQQSASKEEVQAVRSSGTTFTTT